MPRSEKLRKTGIEILGDVPWGTHLCHFYTAKGDLVEILVPYFKAGLENNEFCMWVTSQPLGIEEAKESLRKAVEDLDKYIGKGQIEVVDAARCYTEAGKFEPGNVLKEWAGSEKKALEKGFEGMRLAGNTFWLEKGDWENFVHYEEKLNSVIGEHKMLVLCSYSLEKCSVLEVLDVTRNHRFALIRRAGKQEIIESSERREIEERVKLFSQVIESSIDGIMTTDSEGIISYVNPAIESLYGYENGELTGKHVGILSPDRKSASKIMSLLKKSGSYHGELIQQKKNKEKFTALLSLSSVKNNEGDVVATLSVVRDLTEYKEIQEGLLRSYRMAEIGQLAAGVAHEFNNLLNIIGGTAQYSKAVKDEKEMQESLDVITKTSERAAGIVRSLLTFAKRTELKKELADIGGAIEEVLNLVKRDLANSGIRIVRKYSEAPRTFVDTGQLEQVFLNIIINARYAMRRGGKLTIILTKDDNFVEIAFNNTGKIITKETLGRIFTPFFSGRTRKRTGIMGTGLGLSISRSIVESHGGKISVESEKGKGTTFTIRLPVIQGIFKELEEGGAAAETGEEGKAAPKSASILIVDDENYICALFKKILEKKGYRVSVANSGREAVNICREKRFDIIYLDIIMPKMDGIKTCKKILKGSPDAKIVFMSGKPIEDKAVSMALDKKEIDFLRKPISVEELLKHTRYILSGRNG